MNKKGWWIFVKPQIRNHLSTGIEGMILGYAYFGFKRRRSK
jgi:hypothetical protein